MPDTATLLTREFTVRATAADAREVTGLAVPYGQVIERYDPEFGTFYERFAPGSVEDHSDGHMYFYGHGEPIGLVTAGQDTPEGYQITARISSTARGDEVYTLLKDGVLTKHSIGFYPVEGHVEKVRLEGDDGPEVDVLVRTKVHARETSVVPFPAYSKADIQQVRSTTTVTPRDKETHMPDTTDTLTREDLKDLDGRLEDLARQFAVVADGGTRDEAPAITYRSHGEFLKALAKGEGRDDVEALNRAYEGATTGDGVSAPSWIERDVKLVEVNRPIFNLFNRDSLPAEGNTVSYPVFKSKSGDVAKQAAEGDDLTYLKLVIDSASADIGTYGGYAELTRQAIDRLPVSYLNKVLRMLKISYGKNTNGIVRSVLTGATGTNTVVDISTQATDPKAWIGAAVDAVGNIENNSTGLSAEFILMGLPHFKTLATITDAADRPVFVINGDGSNSIGNVDLRGLKANVGGLPVVVDPGLTGMHAYACSGEALTLLESPGAPFSLEDENIINLTKAFSLYGYLATTLDDAKGIQKIKVSA